MQAPAERPSRSSERSTPKSRGPEDGPDHGLLADVAERPEILQRLLAEGVEALRGVDRSSLEAPLDLLVARDRARESPGQPPRQ